MPAGRPSEYKPEYASIAAKLCEFGATDEDLAEALGKGVRTIYRWAAEHEEFRQALKTGKDGPDDRVERSLYHRAVGFSHPDVHVSVYEGKVTLTPIVKHYPPDTTAALAWLNNRRPDRWRQRKEEAPADAAAAAAAIRAILNAVDAVTDADA
jgi:hypothetical protein